MNDIIDFHIEQLKQQMVNACSDIHYLLEGSSDEELIDMCEMVGFEDDASGPLARAICAFDGPLSLMQRYALAAHIVDNQDLWDDE